MRIRVSSRTRTDLKGGKGEKAPVALDVKPSEPDRPTRMWSLLLPPTFPPERK